MEKASIVRFETPPDKHSLSKLWFIAIPIIFFLFGYTGTLRWFYNNHFISVPLPSPTSTSISWKTYSHDKCGNNPQFLNHPFTIQIPSNWIEDINTVDSATRYEYSSNNHFFRVVCGDGFGGGGYYNPEVDTVIKNDYVIDGRATEGKLVRIKESNYLYLTPTTVKSEKGGLTFQFTAQLPFSETNIQLINQILSTFKFIN